MKKIPATNSIICQNNDHVFNYYGWPTVARLPDGTLAAVASGHRLGHVCPFGKAVMYYSRDEGKTWGEQIIVIDTPLDDRDAGIAVFGSGNVIVTSFNNSAAAQRNYAKQKSGMELSLISSYLDIIEKTPEIEQKYLGSTFRISKDGGYTFGKLQHSPVTAPHGPVVMPDGNLLYVGNKYDGKSNEDDCKINCYKMNDKGEFEYLSSIDALPSSWEPHAVVMPDGKIIVHIRTENGGLFTVYQSESCDGGKTFTTPHPIGLDHGSPPHLLLHSSGVLISSYGYRREPFGQRVMFCKDGGEKWETDYILRDDGNDGDLGYPATVELKDGSLLTVYYQAEKGRSNCVIMQSIWELPKMIYK
ncbi:MAG: glycoside hydrolase [Oscillospiraceae bacterium]|nr:glycoside hydrolase [Oscillospiraceae bacterium]